EERGLVEALLALERRRPAHDPRAEERRPGPLRAHRPAVADEEARDEHERPHKVEADGDGALHGAAAEKTGEQRERPGDPRDAGEQDDKAAQRRSPHYETGSRVECRISSSV